MAERLRKRGDIWYATVYLHHPDGSVQRFERSTGCSDKASARTVRATWEREGADPHHAAARTSLNDVLTLLLEDRAARVLEQVGAAETVAYYKSKVGHLVRVLGRETPVSTFRTSSESWKYIDQRRHEGANTRTIGKELQVLRTALSLAKSRGAFDGDPQVAYPADFTPAEDNEPGRSLTRKEALSLFRFLLPDAAAVFAFSLATGAEMSALLHARREDVPNDIDTVMKVFVRGTKNANRTAYVPLVTDEQRALLRYALEHAQGTDGALFGGSLSNFHRALIEAADEAHIPHVSPHDCRRTAGQWLIDLGAPLELVSRFMRHADTRITETVYAKVKTEDVPDRILDSIDPRYARTAHQSRPKRPVVQTIESVPPPKLGRETMYKVSEVERSLSGWAKASGISKATLHYRIHVRGLSMAEALAGGRKGQRVVRDGAAAPVPQTDRTPVDAVDKNNSGSPKQPRENKQYSARPGRFERPTTGSVDPSARPKGRQIGPFPGGAAAPVPHSVPLPITVPRTKAACSAADRSVAPTPGWQQVVEGARRRRRARTRFERVVDGDDE